MHTMINTEMPMQVFQWSEECEIPEPVPEWRQRASCAIQMMEIKRNTKNNNNQMAK